MIFVDANVPMYIVGDEHPNRRRIAEVLIGLFRQGERFVTDVEVYQEILHRYKAIRRLDAADLAFRSLDRIVSHIYRYGREDVDEAKAILATAPGLPARDAIHIAVMRRAGVSRILSFDRGFDAFPEVERVS